MKKKVKKEVMVERSFCNICEKEITSVIHDPKRILMVRGLFKCTDFDAHATCINRITRMAFKKYI